MGGVGCELCVREVTAEHVTPPHQNGQSMDLVAQMS